MCVCVCVCVWQIWVPSQVWFHCSNPNFSSAQICSISTNTLSFASTGWLKNLKGICIYNELSQSQIFVVL